MTRLVRSLVAVVVALVGSLMAQPSVQAQATASSTLVEASGEFTRPDASGKAELRVTAKVSEGWHIYSLTQAPGGPIRSKIKLDDSTAYQLVGEFKPEQKPDVHEYPNAWPGLKVEEHHGTVTWTAEIQLAEGVDPADLEIKGAVYAQACAEQCIAPKNYRFVAKLSDRASRSDREAVAAPAKGAGDRSSVATALPAGGATRDQEKPQVGEYQGKNIHAALTGEVSPSTAVPGGTFELTITAKPAPTWHIYALSDKPAAKTGSRPTLIELAETSGLAIKEVKSSAAAKQKNDPFEGTVRYHEQQVTWTVVLQVPQDAKPGGKLAIAGVIGYQTCMSTADNRGMCDLPHAARFEAAVEVGNAQGIKPVPLSFTRAKYGEAEQLAKKRSETRGAMSQTRGDGESADPAPPRPSPLQADAGVPGYDLSRLRLADDSEAERSTLYYLAFAFLGGLILNLMPCVLPVVGLKILAFVEQSHHDRWQIIKLNLWYSAGLVAVFLALATVPVVYQVAFNQSYNWGQQFGDDRFTVTLAVIVFVMAISMVGVWEIPIPGFVGGRKAHELTTKEGASGAFAKGVVTTILATPCAGPLMGTALGWALRQPPHLIYAVFASIGIGMASPYFVIGAFPRLIRFLPKPGAWMDTFKQTMGFVLLGTVVYLLTIIDWTLVVPTIAFLVSLWAACWWIGRVPYTAAGSQRLMAWGWAIAFAAFMGIVSFDWLGGVMRERFDRRLNAEFNRLGQNTATFAQTRGSSERLSWQPFSLAALGQLAGRKTIMVDFTADWCPNCKLLDNTVLNSDDLRDLVTQNGIVPLLADYTDSDDSPEIAAMLDALRSSSIPVMAIFPADRPYEPIVFRDLYTKNMLLDALNEAGPSKTTDSDSRPVALRGAE